MECIALKKHKKIIALKKYKKQKPLCPDSLKIR